MKLVIVGSIALDSVTTPFGKRDDVLGGSASYASVAASHFTEVGIVGVVGNDFPSQYLDLLTRHKVDTSGLKVEDGQTFRWVGRYEENLSAAITIDTQLNVFETFSPKLDEAHKQCRHVFLANIHPALQKSVRADTKNGAFVVADTMNLWIDTTRDELLKVIDGIPLFTLNEGEARMLSGEYHLQRAAQKLLTMGPKRLIIKRGEYGAVLFSEDRWFSVPAMLLDQLSDPTGAGDTFAGGMMGYLSATDDHSFEGLREALIFGSIMASFTVQGFSLERLSALSRDDIVARYREFRQSITYPGQERLPW